MVYSMTGFGRAEFSEGEKHFIVEVKALNGKQFDLQMRMPPFIKPYEIEIRNLLQEHLLRGSVECYITLKQNGVSKPVALNGDLVKAFYLQAEMIALELKADTTGVLASIVAMPEMISSGSETISEEDYATLKNVLLEAIQLLKEHRATEGTSLYKDLLIRIQHIEQEEKEIKGLAPNRNVRIKEDLQSLLEKHVGAEIMDGNRLEQELIYYMEKIDIHEEQIRLRQHCEYFLSILNSDEEGKGKKLGFVLQEIGREINTTGSKAYDADIQKSVVRMKDELEKAKEQILNVL